MAFAAWAALRLVVLRRNYQFVIVQGYALAALVANLIGRLLGRPVTMLVCSPLEVYYRCREATRDPKKPFRNLEYRGLQLLAWLNARVGRHYVVLSRYLGDVVRAHGARGVIDVVPVYGVDLEVFSPSDRPPSSLRVALGLPSTGAVVLYSSRVAPEKDANTLLLALKALRESGTELWIVNRSGGHREFAERAAQLGVGDYVLVGDAVDPQSELSALYQAASLCVQASREEGLGFSPLEALACGTPVVATAVGGLLETIIDGQTGWTYPRGDARCLAEVLREALANPAEARRRTELGRELVRQRFERFMVFDRFMGVIRRVIEGTSARGAAPDP